MLAPTDDQQLIRDSAERLVRDSRAAGWPVHRDAPTPVWQSMTELGWMALAVPEQFGGLGGSVADLAGLTSELGRGLMAGSYALNSVRAALLLSAAPEGELRSSLLEALISGSRALAVAAGPQCTVRYTGTSLEGNCSNIWICDETRQLLVCAGDALLVVAIDSPGVEATKFATVDTGQALNCRFESPPIAVSSPIIQEADACAWDVASILMVAECVGMMKTLVELTAEHLKSRKQFGKPLAQFQVLRHRMADMALLSRRAEVLCDRVVQQFESLAAAERARLVAACCVKGLAGLRWVAEQAIQLHGGMGISAELPVGRFLRRSIALEATFGTPEQHRERFQELAP